eukprot:347498-Chlamydomonas_euryale.AAC.1
MARSWLMSNCGRRSSSSCPHSELFFHLACLRRLLVHQAHASSPACPRPQVRRPDWPLLCAAVPPRGAVPEGSNARRLPGVLAVHAAQGGCSFRGL